MYVCSSSSHHIPVRFRKHRYYYYLVPPKKQSKKQNKEQRKTFVFSHSHSYSPIFVFSTLVYHCGGSLPTSSPAPHKKRLHEYDNRLLLFDWVWYIVCMSCKVSNRHLYLPYPPHPQESVINGHLRTFHQDNKIRQSLYPFAPSPPPCKRLPILSSCILKLLIDLCLCNSAWQK